MVYEAAEPQKSGRLFENWEETLIWSALQGIMGKIYVTDMQNPLSAIAAVGDFCFLAGVENRELAECRQIWASRDFMIMVPQNAEWGRMIEEIYGENARPAVRYAFKKEKNVFDRKRLADMAGTLPGEFELKMIDESAYYQCRASGWAADLVAQFKSYEDYEQLGLGAVILKDGIIVSGASSYARYQEGIEIEIDTKEGFRRRGLASVCGAKLILECLAQGLYPSWDAQNLWSAGLAEKLGYHFSHAYTAYEVWNADH